MPKTIQLRNVPESLHRRLRTIAAQEGMSLSAFLVREFGRIAEQPTRSELLERIRARSPRESRMSSAQIIRAERDKR